MTANEVWKPVVGFEGFYEVSDLGRVRSLDRTTVCVWGRCSQPRPRRFAGRVLRPGINRKRGNYRQVNLTANGVSVQRRVAVLVAAAFLGPRPPEAEVCHGNGDPQDDRLVNLRYGTRADNKADMVRHGTQSRGETSPVARLTEAQARQAKYGREPAELVAAKLGVHPGHVNNIRRGIRWSHV